MIPKKHSFFILIFVLLSFYGKAQVFINSYDSIGYKQGKWIEYRAIPTGTITGGQKVYNSDSSIVYSSDLDVYEGDCFLIKQVGNYGNSLRVDLWKEYWPNGLLKNEVNYSKGIPLGECAFYYEDGKLLMRGIISYDSLSIREIYDQKGKLIRIEKGSAKETIKILSR